jgi:hypothetical protein
MNELISKTIDRHSRKLHLLFWITNVLIILGNYIDSTLAADHALTNGLVYYPGNTWLVLALLSGNVIAAYSISHFLKKVLSDLSHDLEIKRQNSEKAEPD